MRSLALLEQLKARMSRYLSICWPFFFLLLLFYGYTVLLFITRERFRLDLYTTRHEWEVIPCQSTIKRKDRPAFPMIKSISANADGSRNAASRKIDHIALPTEYNYHCRQQASVNSKLLHRQSNGGYYHIGLFER